MKLLKQLIERIDTLSLRERGVVLFGILFVLYFVWDVFLMRPLEIRQTQVKSNIELKNSEVLIANTNLQRIILESRTDPNAENKKKLTGLKKALMDMEARLSLATAHMVEPGKMAKVLETVLNKTNGLHLLQLNGLGSSPLIPDEMPQKNKQIDQGKQISGESQETTAVPITTAFKHGFKIKFSGDYFGTLSYLRKLEGLDWKFYWDSIDYSVSEYPESVVTVSVYTISLNSNWIGI